jgi:hypothetical protein
MNRNQTIKVATVVVVGTAVGVGSYFAYKRWVKSKTIVIKPEAVQLNLFDTTERFDAEVDRVFEEIHQELDAEEVVEEVVEEALIVTNVFASLDEGWDYEAELSTRTDPKIPYIIHQEEFVNDEMGYHQETLTYYAGDDIMADSHDTPIYGYEGLMGELRFGHGSRDKNVVYIRNEGIHMEWEILLHSGHFSIEVLGLEAEKEIEQNELRHSVHKFRRD